MEHSQQPSTQGRFPHRTNQRCCYVRTSLCCPSFPFPPPPPSFGEERLFAVFDKKCSGEIDYEEFVCGLAVTCRGSWEEKVRMCVPSPFFRGTTRSFVPFEAPSFGSGNTFLSRMVGIFYVATNVIYFLCARNLYRYGYFLMSSAHLGWKKKKCSKPIQQKSFAHDGQSR